MHELVVHSFYILEMEGEGDTHFRFRDPAKEYLCVRSTGI